MTGPPDDPPRLYEPPSARPPLYTPPAAAQPPLTPTTTPASPAPPAQAAPPAAPPVEAGPPNASIDTSNRRLHDGVNRCPKCGATEIQFRPVDGMLVCLFCRHEWSEARLDTTIDTGDLGSLSGTIVGTGAADISADANSLMTLKCQGCGAEVVINTAEQMGARCHWCRHVLTVNEQIPNGAVPDAVLPFTITHDQAVATIAEFARKRRAFAARAFVHEFSPETVVGVYMPYMVVDAKASADLSGVGEFETRRYMRGSDDNKQQYYDADVYAVERHIDFTVDDLTLEASADRANLNTAVNTNNVINAVLPFDTENAVAWNAAYLTGFTSEKRDQNVGARTPELENQLLSIARAHVVDSIRPYDRGVRWERERLQVAGTRWLAMCLPVWLYSYRYEKGGQAMVHYIAVNGRTGEVMGSVPVSTPRLFAVALTAGTVLEAFAIALIAAMAR